MLDDTANKKTLSVVGCGFYGSTKDKTLIAICKAIGYAA
jgi:hypothetical protein